MRHTADIRYDGTVLWHGLDTGKTTALVRNEKEGLIALKIAGHSYQSGREQRYAKARIRILRYRTIGTFEAGKQGAKTAGIVAEFSEIFGLLEWDVRPRIAD